MQQTTKQQIIITGAFRFPVGDASAARVLNNAKILRELGYEVLFVSWGGTPRAEDRTADGTYRYQGFEYLCTGDLRTVKMRPLQRIYNFVTCGKKALKLIKQLPVQPAALIIYDSPLLFSLRAHLYGRRRNITLISDLTEWYSPEELPGGRFAPPVWMNELNMRWMQKRIRNKILISDFLANYYRASNNLVLPPLTDSTDPKWHFDPNQVSLPAAYDGLRLVYAGTPNHKDLLETMLRAVVNLLRERIVVQFVIAGVSYADIRGYAQYDQIGNYPENIVFLGRIPQQAVPSYYAISDFSLLIRPQTKKSKAGFPTKLAETLTAGCPVIANLTSDIGRYIADGYNSLQTGDCSEQALTETLRRAANLSREQITTMKAQTRERAAELFDYTRHTEPMRRFLHTAGVPAADK